MLRILLLVLSFVTLISCSSDKQDIRQNIENKVQNMADSDVVNELIIKVDGDKEKLGRILECSVFTIDRIKNKETFLTVNSRKEFQNVLLDIEFNGKEVLKERDPYYDSWIRSFRLWLDNIIWYVVVISVLGAIVGYFGLGGLGLIPLGLYGLVYLIIWILGKIWSYDNPAYLYIEKINPIVETLL